MCNAFGLNAPIAKVAETFRELRIPLRFEGAGGAPNLAPTDMIRPTEAAAVVTPGEGGEARLETLRWGFAPPARGGGGYAPPVINFRSEGRTFGQEGRALVLASHFFEYTGAKSPKTRWRFTKAGPDVAAEDPFAIAGWVRPAAGAGGPLTRAGEPWPKSFTVLTTAPGEDIAPYHDRQVVILDRADWARWLFAPAEEVKALLAPCPAGALRVTQDR